MIDRIKETITKWLGIDSEIDRLEKVIAVLRNDIHRAESEIIKRTDISVDPSVHKSGYNYIFVSGRYKNNDYVRLFQIPGIELSSLIDHLRMIEKQEYGKVNRIDRDFSGISEIITRELDR